MQIGNLSWSSFDRVTQAYVPSLFYFLFWGLGNTDKNSEEV
jgi:hypothetical protein